MIDIVRKAQIENSYIPKRYLVNKLIPNAKDLEEFKKLNNIFNRIEEFVKDGHNLMIYSANCGNGKTSWACKLGINYIDQYASNYSIEVPVVFINAAEYINKKKAAINDKSLIDYINKLDKDLYNADLVIWDDIATKSLSEYDMDQLYVFINNRISNMKSNIFTSNCTKSEMTNIMGKRLASRIDNNSIHIELKGLDNRKDTFNFDSAANN